MSNLDVVMINVTSRDDGRRVLDRIDAATESGEISGISDKLIKQAGEAIDTYGAVVFVLADQANTKTITSLIDKAVASGAKMGQSWTPRTDELRLAPSVGQVAGWGTASGRGALVPFPIPRDLESRCVSARIRWPW